ncbi:hypothetical protein M758_2G218000 [Ceratodon purpureus]|nr:hypothetical protein M758_2G218000 [Ceratodon purpureus]
MHAASSPLILTLTLTQCTLTTAYPSLQHLPNFYTHSPNRHTPDLNSSPIFSTQLLT